MSDINGNGKLDVLIDQVGRLTEGITDLKGVVEKVSSNVDRVALTVERIAHTTENQEQNIKRLTALFEQQHTEAIERLERIEHSTESQTQNINRLATLFEQQSQKQTETTDRLVRIVENLLAAKG